MSEVLRYSSKVKAVINAGSAGPPSVSCQNPWLRTCFSLMQEGPLRNWNLGRGVEESRRGEGGEQRRKAGRSANLPPGSALCSACAPRPQRALDSKHDLCQPIVNLCPVVNVSGPPCFQNMVAPTRAPHSSSLALILYNTIYFPDSFLPTSKPLPKSHKVANNARTPSLCRHGTRSHVCGRAAR